MDNVQYPAAATIKAFGGIVEMAKAMGLHKQTVHKWKATKSGFIPRWWSDRVKVIAEANGVKLPKPRKAVKNGGR